MEKLCDGRDSEQNVCTKTMREIDEKLDRLSRNEELIQADALTRNKRGV